jgi:hypothetical protein
MASTRYCPGMLAKDCREGSGGGISFRRIVVILRGSGSGQVEGPKVSTAVAARTDSMGLPWSNPRGNLVSKRIYVADVKTDAPRTKKHLMALPDERPLRHAST